MKAQVLLRSELRDLRMDLKTLRLLLDFDYFMLKMIVVARD